MQFASFKWNFKCWWNIFRRIKKSFLPNIMQDSSPSCEFRNFRFVKPFLVRLSSNYFQDWLVIHHIVSRQDHWNPQMGLRSMIHHYYKRMDNQHCNGVRRHCYRLHLRFLISQCPRHQTINLKYNEWSKRMIFQIKFLLRNVCKKRYNFLKYFKFVFLKFVFIICVDEFFFISFSQRNSISKTFIIVHLLYY